jgi:Ca-activated chloride channel family protein
VSAYLDYQNTDRGNPVVITLPAETGDYEMRYVLGAPQRVLASLPFKVGTVEAKLTVPQIAAAGSEIEVAWTGPGYASDWITVVKPDAPVSQYGDYFTANPANTKLEMPVEPGDYEVRYVLDGKRVLARVPITVTPVSATLEAPAGVAAEQKFDVAWSGPNAAGDWITIVKPEAGETAYLSYEYTTKGTPISLLAPKEPGAYELRYVLRGKRILARRAIQVTAP